MNKKLENNLTGQLGKIMLKRHIENIINKNKLKINDIYMDDNNQLVIETQRLPKLITVNSKFE